jgi:hypothetical protein
LKNPLLKILVTIGSVISISCGLWHVFVPSIWNERVEVNEVEKIYIRKIGLQIISPEDIFKMYNG